MSDWNSFLLTQGAAPDSQGNVDMPHKAPTPDRTYMMPLQQQGLLALDGIDAGKFLQGQVTCDVRELENHSTRLGAQCNIKGRMLLCFRALQTGSQQILLRMHRDMVATGLGSFGKYSVFFKVKLSDASTDYRCIGIAGARAQQVVAEVFNLEIAANDSWQASGENLIIRINDSQFECWLSAAQAEQVWEKLAVYCETAGQNLWTLLNIQAGIGDITPLTFETFTPQGINFQWVNGINFRKGCYTGQEIVARLHYRGNLKRHMYRFEFAFNGTLPSPGSELHNSEGKAVGELVIAAQKTDMTGELLASVVDDQCQDLFLPHNPQKLSPLPLPYAIPTADKAD
ncbi:MAG TPA: hypothetical protein VN030_01215 [Cellvibrio sp.]|nr:hypothetical protein [Cellvibrio sp.]